MAWFERFRRRLKNYTSDGDYAGSHGGGGGSAERDTRNANAQGQAHRKPPGPFRRWRRIRLTDGRQLAATTAISMRHSGRASAGTVTSVDAARCAPSALSRAAITGARSSPTTT